MAGLDLTDIQGFIVRSYAMPALRVFALRVDQPEQARQFLGGLVGPDESPDLRLTTAEPWTTKPDYCVNVGLTFDGLRALQLPPASLDSFPDEFVQGAVARAERVGDVVESAPAHWRAALTTPDLHVLVFVFAQRADALSAVSAMLRVVFAESALTELAAYDAHGLPGEVAHFGYRDGFSQPTIAGGAPPLIPDVLPPAPAGEFLLGYPSQYDQFTYPAPSPDELGRNGSFVAFRILEQDCDAFEQFLRDAPARYGIDPELLAAKICGRWRNGVPLALSPDTDAPTPPIPSDGMNSFDYAPTDNEPELYDDRRGYRCPIGAHIRRANPRHSTVAGASGLKRRIMRRGLPYGPPYDPTQPNDNVERGLLGLFIGVSLKDQFEFVMAEWVNNGTFAPGLGSTRDPVLGNNSAEVSKFVIPVEGKQAITVTGFSRFIRTRGGAYCFLPSATSLRHIARLPPA